MNPFTNTTEQERRSRFIANAERWEQTFIRYFAVALPKELVYEYNQEAGEFNFFRATSSNRYCPVMFLARNDTGNLEPEWFLWSEARHGDDDSEEAWGPYDAAVRLVAEWALAEAIGDWEAMADREACKAEEAWWAEEQERLKEEEYIIRAWQQADAEAEARERSAEEEARLLEDCPEPETAEAAAEETAYLKMLLNHGEIEGQAEYDYEAKLDARKYGLI